MTSVWVVLVHYLSKFHGLISRIIGRILKVIIDMLFHSLICHLNPNLVSDFFFLYFLLIPCLIKNKAGSFKCFVFLF